MYYVVQVSTGQEAETMELIKKKISPELVLDVFSPTLKYRRKFKTGWREVTKRCFPGYIFIESPSPQALFLELYKIPMFTRLLGKDRSSDGFVPLTKEESDLIDTLADKNNDRTVDISNVKISEGQIVHVLDGSLTGRLVKLVKVNLHKPLVNVSFDMMGREMTVDLGINIVVEKE
ncbi:hypothetical protein GX831_04605 [bacterium]|nr:hypothetical protein [bacterium]